MREATGEPWFETEGTNRPEINIPHYFIIYETISYLDVWEKVRIKDIEKLVKLVEEIWIKFFGSWGDRKHMADSDIDIFIVYDKERYDGYKVHRALMKSPRTPRV